MLDELTLPKDKSQRETVVKKLIDDGKRTRHIPEINWWLNHYYLQGARDFTNINYQTGTLNVSYIDEEGILRFRYDDIVSKFQAQVGRLMQIDISPRVTNKSIGLDAIKKASIGQVALDYAFPKSKVEELKLEVTPALSKYGCIGLAVWSDEEEMGIDVVMPWEIIPIPPNPIEDNDVRGLCRNRKVPLEWIQGLEQTPDKSAKVWKEVDVIAHPTGEVPTKTSSHTGTLLSEEAISTDPGMGGKTGGSKAKKDETHQEVAEFTEIWTWGANGYLKDYYMYAGDKEVFFKEYSQFKLTVPLQIVRDIKTGGFWGRSFVSVMLPLNQEMEYTIGRVFQNIQDIDAYGLLLEPTSMGLPQEIFRGIDGIKRVRYEPDYMVPDMVPKNIAPVNSGLLPVKAIEMGTKLSEMLANQPTALMGGKAPGRVDSQAALGFLFEVSNTPLTSTAVGWATAMSNCYRAMLGVANIAWPTDKMVSVTMLDDTLAGISLDSASGDMSLSENNIPHPNDVEISVRAMLPRSAEQKKMELAKALEMGAIDMFEYRIMVRKEGIELPVGNEAEWQNYRRAMMENIVLFGDGEKPGQVIVSELDIHEVHNRVLQAFMARPEFYQAKPEVREAFIQHFGEHNLGMATIPDEMPQMEDAAAEADMMQQAEGQMGGATQPGESNMY